MLNTLRQIVQAFAQEADFAASVRMLVQRVRDALGSEVCSIYLLNESRDGYRLVATKGLNESQVGEVTLAQDQGLVGLVGRRAEPLNLDAAQEHPNFYFVPEIGEEPFNAFLGVPIMHQGRVLGVLVAQQRDPRRFDEGEEAFMVTLSAQLATEVAHAEAIGASTMFGRKHEADIEGYFAGLPGSPGIAIGSSVVLHPIANLESVPERSANDITVELTLLDRAIDAVRSDIRGIIEEFKTSLPQEELALFDAYFHMLDDNALAGDIRERVRLGQWAQGALKQVIREHVGRFELMEDPYLKERGSDVKDLGVRILGYLQRIREKKNPISQRHDTGRRGSYTLHAHQHSSRSPARCGVAARFRQFSCGDSCPRDGHSGRHGCSRPAWLRPRGRADYSRRPLRRGLHQSK